MYFLYGNLKRAKKNEYCAMATHAFKTAPETRSSNLAPERDFCVDLQ